MNILLVGGSSDLMNQLIIKLKKEGHRVFLLTGNQYERKDYEKVFEVYNFSYENDSLHEIFASVSPDVTIFLGAYDTNFHWHESERESVRYISGLMNVLVAYRTLKQGKFIYLSSEEVFGSGSKEDITEDMPVEATGFRGMALVEAERICEDYRLNWNLDIYTLRLDHLYTIPKKSSEINSICANMCLQALENKYIMVDKNLIYSFLYVSDAVEFIYKIISTRKSRYYLYHISSSQPITELELGKIIEKNSDDSIRVVEVEKQGDYRSVLSNERFIQECGVSVRNPLEDVIK